MCIYIYSFSELTFNFYNRIQINLFIFIMNTVIISLILMMFSISYQ